MGRNRNVDAFSRYRLGGEPTPADVAILLAHPDELFEHTGIELNWKKGWAPWLDTSYLSEAERANPDIAAVTSRAGIDPPATRQAALWS